MYKVISLAILSVCIITPFNNDVFLAGLPEMAMYFHTNNIAAVVSICLLGLAVAQPFYGPLSDRFGRKPVLLAGLIIYMLGSASLLFSTHFSWFLAGRFLQALGACSTLITALAIIRDSYPKDQTIKYTSGLIALVGICAALGPLIGSALISHWNWRVAFEFLFALGLLYLVVVAFLYKETIPAKNYAALGWQRSLANYRQLLQRPNMLNYVFISACAYGLLFSYLALAPTFLIEDLKVSTLTCGLIIALNAMPTVACALIVPKLFHRYLLSNILLSGLALIVTGGLLMVLINSMFAYNMFSLMAPMFIVTAGIGILRPSASTGIMNLAPANLAGTSASLFAFSAFVGGSVMSLLTSHLTSTPLLFGLFIVLIGSLGIICACHPANTAHSPKTI